MPESNIIEVALVYPNTYAVGMASLGFRTVYALLSSRENVSCERAFTKTGPSQEVSRTLEGQRRLDEFDIVAFSISYENDLPHLVGALSSSGISPFRDERDPGSPLIIAGGPFVLINPEPLAPLVDVLFIGEGEVLLPDFCDVLDAASGAVDCKDAIINELKGREGFYVPSDQGASSQAMVKRVYLSDFDKYVWKEEQLVAPDSHFGDAYLIEVGRGCPRKCRFCAARSIYSPVRYRTIESIDEEIGRIGPEPNGVGFLGASLSDYNQLREVVLEAQASGHSVQTSSLRMDMLSSGLLDILRECGVRTITTAPEAGSERLRRVLRKDLKEGAILSSAERIGEAGFPQLKLYFMIGLPGETDRDMVDLAMLILRIDERIKKAKGRTKITACLSPFVPKPWTPFQWAAFERPALLRERMQIVRRLVKGRVKVKADSTSGAAYQALLSRGDHRVGRALAHSVTEGKSVSSALKDAGLSKAWYLHRERDKDEAFPWDFIDHGIEKECLLQEWEKAKREASG